MAIRTILALALAGGLSQTDQDARPLLQGVANASSALTTFRAEGRIDQDLDIGLGGGKWTLRFRVATREPRQARVEISGGEESGRSDVTDLLKELHVIVNEAIRSQQLPADSEKPPRQYDLSQVDLEMLDARAQEVDRRRVCILAMRLLSPVNQIV
jgi:hypothetical protein